MFQHFLVTRDKAEMLDRIVAAGFDVSISLNSNNTVTMTAVQQATGKGIVAGGIHNSMESASEALFNAFEKKTTDTGGDEEERDNSEAEQEDTGD